jgi:Tol biopolymer transport system component
MKSLVKTSAFLFLVFVFGATANAQTPANWTPETQVKTKAVGGVQVSPDGKRVVYTVNEAVMTADKSEFVTQIWLAETDGRNAFQITFGDKSSTNPKWSPDGNWIAFTSNRKDNRNNLYMLRAAGGVAEPLTDLKGSVANFEWSPDGTKIAYMSSHKAERKTQNNTINDDAETGATPKATRL